MKSLRSLAPVLVLMLIALLLGGLVIMNRFGAGPVETARERVLSAGHEPTQIQVLKTDTTHNLIGQVATVHFQVIDNDGEKRADVKLEKPLWSQTWIVIEYAEKDADDPD